MANRIVATFSPEDVKAMGPRFSGLIEAMTPLMNTLAGEVVCWTQNSDGAWLVLASSKPVYRWTNTRDVRWRVAPGPLSDF